MTTTLHLFESFAGSPPEKADPVKGIVYGVKVAGSKSPSNKRTYAPGVLAAAVDLYEGAPVNIDHVRKPGEARKSDDRFGFLRNVTVKADGLYGDIHHLTSHPMASRVQEAADKMPQAFGMSHDALADSTVDKSGETVIKIKQVNSVDLVPNPGSTKSLFESEGEPMAIQPTPGPVLDIMRHAALSLAGKQARLVNLTEEEVMTTDPLFAPETVEAGADLIAQAFESAVLSIIKDESLDVNTKKKKIGELLVQEDKVKAILTDATAAPAETPTVPAETPAIPAETPPEKPMEESAKVLAGIGKQIVESIAQGFANMKPGATRVKPRTTALHVQEQVNGHATTTPTDLDAAAAMLQRRG